MSLSCTTKKEVRKKYCEKISRCEGETSGIRGDARARVSVAYHSKPIYQRERVGGLGKA
jgi:hypothetical protein